MQASHVLEVVIFKVKPDSVEKISELRANLQNTLATFNGFVEFKGYYPMGDNTFVDVVKWDDIGSAQVVAKAFQQGDVRFQAYMSAIDSLIFMGHFSPSP